MDDLPPWLERPAAMPMAPAAQPLLRQPPRRLDTLAHRAAAGEAVHWGVVGLTLFTALSVLLGAFGGDEAKPRELLPIIMTVTAP